MGPVEPSATRPPSNSPYHCRADHLRNCGGFRAFNFALYQQISTAVYNY